MIAILFGCDFREYSAMSDESEVIRQWLRDELKKAGRGVNRRLAEYVGTTPQAISRMVNDDPTKEMRRIESWELLKMMDFFGSSPGQTWSAVPIMGYLGAGAEVEPDFEQVPPEGLDEIDVPFTLPSEMIAFRVRGESMLPVYKDGEVIVVYREQQKPIESFYGEEAAVRTTDGRRFIKTIMRGQDGTVTLMSWNAQPIENVEIEWVGEIFAALPPSSLRRVSRQGGIQGRLRLAAG